MLWLQVTDTEYDFFVLPVGWLRKIVISVTEITFICFAVSGQVTTGTGKIWRCIYIP